jgi:hypothetical protein
MNNLRIASGMILTNKLSFFLMRILFNIDIPLQGNITG